ATAYATNAPVLCLAGQIHQDQIGRGYGLLHEIPDQLTVMRSLTKWARRAESSGELPQLLATALSEVRSGRPRPVGLEMPMNVLSGEAEMSESPLPLTVRRPAVDNDTIEEAARLMGKARNPVIFVGGGAMDAGEEVRALAEALQAPVIASGRGRGILSSRHPFSHTFAAGEPLWEQADLAVAIGTRLTKPLIDWKSPDHLSLIRIEIAPQDSSFLAPAAVTVAADSQDALRALLPALARHNRQRPSRTAEMLALHKEMEQLYDSLQPQIDFIRAIRDTLPDDGIFVDELTQVGYASNIALPVYQPRTFLTPNYQGTLGWGFPTALGAKVAAPDRSVLSIAGDGGFLYCATELATAVQHGINTVSVIFNDGAYGNVRRMQKELYAGRLISSDLENPDFVAFVESFGAIGVRVHTPNSLRDALTDAFTADRPVVIEVPVGEMPGPWRMMYPNELLVED
ncbi:MAG: thiamine pyrophosphate-dependent enzyme, partial [Caldilineaceae bacterium]|nr:thiamine pyrophosphate-dependent enzyme [Caldilineaceae bacterium]